MATPTLSARSLAFQRDGQTTAAVNNNNNNLLISENFTLVCSDSVFVIERIIRNKNAQEHIQANYITMSFDQIKPYKKMRLTLEAQRIQHTPNAGGSSVESEALSFEILKRFFNAHLVKTEMEVAYFPMGGSITDYVVMIFGSVVGVSVARAMKYGNDDMFTLEDATKLLNKKLKGILQACCAIAVITQ